MAKRPLKPPNSEMTTMKTRMRTSETVLLPVAWRQLESHSESETVQYCSGGLRPFMCPGGMRKFQSVHLRLVVKRFDPSKSRASIWLMIRPPTMA